MTAPLTHILPLPTSTGPPPSSSLPQQPQQQQQQQQVVNNNATDMDIGTMAAQLAAELAAGGSADALMEALAGLPQVTDYLAD